MTRKPLSLIKERDIQRTVTEYLALDGWRAFRTEHCWDERKRREVGEIGMPDCLYLRYELDFSTAFSAIAPPLDTTPVSPNCIAEVMWIEFKRQRPRGNQAGAEKARLHQKLWHAAERKRGALVLVAGEDFPASIEGFCAWYEQIGLKRGHT